MGKHFLMATAVLIEGFSCENVSTATNSKYWHKKKTSMYSLVFLLQLILAKWQPSYKQDFNTTSFHLRWLVNISTSNCVRLFLKFLLLLMLELRNFRNKGGTGSKPVN